MTGYLIIGALLALILADTVAIWIIIGVCGRLGALEFRELKRERGLV